MFRLTRFLRELTTPTPVGPRRSPPGPVVIWNLVRRCNLACRHCYSASADKDFSGELGTGEVLSALADLRASGVPALILSGGEPLLRPDLFVIAAEAKRLGFHLSLSTNGTLIDATLAARVAEARFDYVGISIDGLPGIHDRFRGRGGAHAAALNGIRHCRRHGLNVGLRFTVTRDNAHQLDDMLALMDDEGVGKFYLSHLNYAGRANRNRGEDAESALARRTMDRLFAAALKDVEAGGRHEFVTGNNDADGPYFLHWVARHFPARADHIRAKLEQWGGNASGLNVANIDNQGWVHPDTMWWHERLGNVRERSFGALWNDAANPLMAALKIHPRAVGGRCAGCRHLAICNGNSRVRAERVHGDRWAEDPGCYLTDEETAWA
jgi:heme d1 biosynthesis radical SAM protein NirJ